MKFVDIKNDIAFRKIFGNEQKKEILISFLNAVLNPDSRIADVKILNPYQFARVKGAKTSIIDVKAVDENGHSYIVEMQVGEKSGLAKRIQYYASKTYSDQVSRGELYMQLRPVILIGIFDFNFLAGRNYLSNHVIMDKETGEHKLQDFDFHFIELPKFKKKADALKTLVDKWIFFIKESENLDVVPPHVDDEGLLAAYDESAKHNWSRQELADYDYISMRIGDEKAKLDFSYQKGRKEGVEQVALRCLKKGMSFEDTVELTGLSAEQVKEIQKEMEKKQ